MSQIDEELYKAALYGDLEKVKACLSKGADINAESNGQTPLMLVISSDDPAQRAALVKFFLDKGADPNFMGDDNCGVVFQAVLSMDAEVMELLLAADADPNFFIDCQSLYDCADMDYQYSMFEFSLPLEPTSKDQKTEEAWLDYLDRCAEMNKVEKPEILRVLRRYGAKTTLELDNMQK